MSPWRREDQPSSFAGPRRRLQGQGTCSTENKQVLTKPGRADHPGSRPLPDTAGIRESTAAGTPPQMRQLWPEKGQPGCPLSTRQGCSVEPPSQSAPERNRAVFSWSQDPPPPPSLPWVQTHLASTCVTCYEPGPSLGGGSAGSMTGLLYLSWGLQDSEPPGQMWPDVQVQPRPGEGMGLQLGPGWAIPGPPYASVLGCGHRCRPSGTCVTQLCTPTAVPGS